MDTSLLSPDRLADVADTYGTPCYVYDAEQLQQRAHALQQAFGTRAHRIFYAVKANGNLAVLQTLAQAGLGFDIVSGGELARVLAAGASAKQVVFSGVGKTEEELRFALREGIACFNVESLAELHSLSAQAQALGVQAPVSLRINPAIDIPGHPYIATGGRSNKFGIDISQAEAAYEQAADLPGLSVIGLDCHIGSQMTDLTCLEAACKQMHTLWQTLKVHGHCLEHLDMGGGLGIPYEGQAVPSPEAYAQLLCDTLPTDAEIFVEPGRWLVGPTGVLLTRIESLKRTGDKHFCIIDAGMNDCLRPALYEAWHTIAPLVPREAPEEMFDIVGPVCESGDFLGKDRRLPTPNPGDILVVQDAGAYGFVMSSQYNGRPRAAEVMLTADGAHLVRRRETIEDLFAHEMRLP